MNNWFKTVIDTYLPNVFFGVNPLLKMYNIRTLKYTYFDSITSHTFPVMYIVI